MPIKCRILEAVPLGSSEYKYSLLGEDICIYSLRLERREHIRIIEKEGDIVGRYIEYNVEKDWFWFVDE